MQHTKVYYKRGEWNQFCHRCGKKVKSSKIKQEWTGLLVCTDCFDIRQPQDYVEGVIDDMAAPWSTSEPVDKFLIDTSYKGLLSGTLITAINAGTEVVFDNINIAAVTLDKGTLSTSTDFSVLDGANVCALVDSNGRCEVFQYVVATPGQSGTYYLSRLLRARVGTDNAMQQGFAAGAKFYYLGQSNASLYMWMQNNLYNGNRSIVDMAYSPVNASAARLPNNDVSLQWIRRTKYFRIDQDTFTDGEVPLDELDEAYEIDVLSGSTVKRTIRVSNITKATYNAADQVTDFGSVQSSYTFKVYQLSNDVLTNRRGSYRQFTL
jgi:hypothetical protein